MSVVSEPPRAARSAQLGRTHAISLEGLTGHVVEVEASLNDGLPTMAVVGLPDASVSESRQRIRTALSNSECALPAKRVTVNLSPGSIRKIGTSFDLAIALAILAAVGRTRAETTARTMHVGELGLDGRLHPVRGIIPALLAARDAGFERAIVPAGNHAEAELVSGIEVRAAVTLTEAANLHGAGLCRPACAPVLGSAPGELPGAELPAVDLAAVRGQLAARWALEVAAAGGHHMLMVGTPGAGKTLLASAMPGILPPLDEADAVEVAAIRSLAGAFDPRDGLDRTPPLIAPHHSTSAAAMTGKAHRIGLMARAHRGVLFLDEAPEFRRDTLEVLRQPLESGRYSVHRASGSAGFPAAFQLVMAANPCPCGKGIGRAPDCECAPQARRRYAARLSGPVRDRVDVQILMHPVALSDLHTVTPAEGSEEVARRVRTARSLQAERYAGRPWRLNAHADAAWLRERFAFTSKETSQVDAALQRGLLTMRGYDRVFRVGTSIADLSERERPGRDDLLAALSLRLSESP